MTRHLVDQIRNRWQELRRGREEGRALVEFVFLAVLILVPLIYLVLTVARVQAASFAVTNATREAGRVFIASPTEESARSRAHEAARIALKDFGFDTVDKIDISCDGTPCLRPDGKVSVTVTANVALPLVPDAISGGGAATIPVTTTSVYPVERFVAR